MSKAWLLLLCLLLPLASANIEAYGSSDGVIYGFAHGEPGSMYASLGPNFDGEGLIDVDGCSISIIKEDTARGRVRAFAYFGGDTVVFDFHNTTRIQVQTEVDSTGGFGLPPSQEIPAEFAMEGYATVEVGRELYVDPVTLDDQFKASYYLTPTGYRHGGTVVHQDGGLYALGDPILLRDDWETHLRIQGASGPSSSTDVVARPADGLGPGRFTTNQAYAERFSFFNEHFRGNGKVSIQFDSDAPEGLNELMFTVRSPSGNVIGNETLAADLLSSDSAEIEFPLNEFGDYYVDVAGRVTLSRYSFSFEQASEEPFDLWLWWENTTVGVPGWQRFSQCYDFIGEPNSVVAMEVGRIQPPQMNLTFVALGIVGTIIVLMTGGRLFGQTVAAARFKSTHKKR